MAKGSLRKFRTGTPDITQESAEAVRGHQQQGARQSAASRHCRRETRGCRVRLTFLCKSCACRRRHANALRHAPGGMPKRREKARVKVV